jgi:hypothetical protein
MNQRQAPISNPLPKWLVPCIGLALLILLAALIGPSLKFSFKRFEVDGDKVIQSPKDLTTAEFKLRTDKNAKGADEPANPKPTPHEGQVQFRPNPVDSLKGVIGATNPKPEEGQLAGSKTKPAIVENPQNGSQPPPAVIQKKDQVPPSTPDPRLEVELLVASALRLLDLNLNLMIAQRRSAFTQNEAARFATLAENNGVEISQQVDRYSKLLDRLATLPKDMVFAEFTKIREDSRAEKGSNILAAGLAETHLRERIEKGKIDRKTLLQDFSQSALRR